MKFWSYCSAPVSWAWYVTSQRKQRLWEAGVTTKLLNQSDEDWRKNFWELWIPSIVNEWSESPEKSCSIPNPVLHWKTRRQKARKVQVEHRIWSLALTGLSATVASRLRKPEWQQNRKPFKAFSVHWWSCSSNSQPQVSGWILSPDICKNGWKDMNLQPIHLL